MTQVAATGPNAEQIEYWNSERARKWVELQERMDALIEAFGARAIERAGLAAGERVIDVGCGCGGTTLDLAGRVGARGRVLGVDISAVMLSRARERAKSVGLANVEFVDADAQTHAFEAGAWDCAFSRFGVMFFADPARAFANLRRALRQGGRVSFACWRAMPENEWVTVPLTALMKVIAPPPPPLPGAPGPFAFGDPQRVRGLLGEAGFARDRPRAARRSACARSRPRRRGRVCDLRGSGEPAARRRVGGGSRARARGRARGARASRARRRGRSHRRDLARHRAQSRLSA